MAQLLRTLSTALEDLSLIPSIHTVTNSQPCVTPVPEDTLLASVGNTHIWLTDIHASKIPMHIK